MRPAISAAVDARQGKAIGMKTPNVPEAEGQQTRAAAGRTTGSANVSKKKASQKKHRGRPSSQPRRNIVGCRISHGWKEGDEPITQWKGTVLDQVPINPSLYLVKYDGIDCVYGLELHRDERVLSLKILSDRVASPQVSDANLANTIIGKAVEHMFEGEHGSKDEWRGMVLAQAPIMKAWFYITYEKDPVLYMYQLLDDYKEGDLRIMPESSESLPAEREPGGVVDGLIGKHVEYTKEDGSKRIGMVIHQVEAKPSHQKTAALSSAITRNRCSPKPHRQDQIFPKLSLRMRTPGLEDTVIADLQRTELSSAWTPASQGCKIINVCYFKQLSLWKCCYAAIDN